MLGSEASYAGPPLESEAERDLADSIEALMARRIFSGKTFLAVERCWAKSCLMSAAFLVANAGARIVSSPPVGISRSILYLLVPSEAEENPAKPGCGYRLTHNLDPDYSVYDGLDRSSSLWVGDCLAAGHIVEPSTPPPPTEALTASLMSGKHPKYDVAQSKVDKSRIVHLLEELDKWFGIGVSTAVPEPVNNSSQNAIAETDPIKGGIGLGAEGRREKAQFFALQDRLNEASGNWIGKGHTLTRSFMVKYEVIFANASPAWRGLKKGAGAGKLDREGEGEGRGERKTPATKKRDGPISERNGDGHELAADERTTSRVLQHKLDSDSSDEDPDDQVVVAPEAAQKEGDDSSDAVTPKVPSTPTRQNNRSTSTIAVDGPMLFSRLDRMSSPSWSAASASSSPTDRCPRRPTTASSVYEASSGPAVKKRKRSVDFTGEGDARSSQASEAPSTLATSGGLETHARPTVTSNNHNSRYELDKASLKSWGYQTDAEWTNLLALSKQLRTREERDDPDDELIECIPILDFLSSTSTEPVTTTSLCVFIDQYLAWNKSLRISNPDSSSRFDDVAIVPSTFLRSFYMSFESRGRSGSLAWEDVKGELDNDTITSLTRSTAVLIPIQLADSFVGIVAMARPRVMLCLHSGETGWMVLLPSIVALLSAMIPAQSVPGGEEWPTEAQHYILFPEESSAAHEHVSPG
ncbi:hypothetical protein IAU60_006936 [Kwoniella sp. DSM 27419]